MSKPRKRKKRTAETDFVEAMSQGTEHLLLGIAREALPHLERAAKLRPQDIDVALNLGGAYVMLNRHTEAIPILEAASEQEPENSKIWINLGAAYLGNPVLARNEQQDRSIAAFERALEINPKAHSVSYNLGLIYRDRGELETAIEHFKQAIAGNPQDDDARNLLRKLEAQLNAAETPKEEGNEPAE